MVKGMSSALLLQQPSGRMDEAPDDDDMDDDIDDNGLLHVTSFSIRNIMSTSGDSSDYPSPNEGEGQLTKTQSLGLSQKNLSLTDVTGGEDDVRAAELKKVSFKIHEPVVDSNAVPKQGGGGDIKEGRGRDTSPAPSLVQTDSLKLSQIFFKGHLDYYKNGLVFGAWKPRYAVLLGQALFLYKNAEGYTLGARPPYTLLLSHKSEFTFNKKSFVFTVHGDQEWVLRAHDAKSHKEWLTKLQTALRAIGLQKRHESS
jgi:hypothetical protein